MRKLGPLLAIISGLSSLVFGTLLLLSTKGYFNIDFLGKYLDQVGSSKTIESAKVGYWVTVVTGSLMIFMGLMAWRKPRGLFSLILLVIYAVSITFTLYGAMNSHSWPIATIISVSINGLAALGLLSGFKMGNK